MLKIRPFIFAGIVVISLTACGTASTSPPATNSVAVPQQALLASSPLGFGSQCLYFYTSNANRQR